MHRSPGPDGGNHIGPMDWRTNCPTEILLYILCPAANGKQSTVWRVQSIVDVLTGRITHLAAPLSLYSDWRGVSVWLWVMAAVAKRREMWLHARGVEIWINWSKTIIQITAADWAEQWVFASIYIVLLQVRGQRVLGPLTRRDEEAAP